MLLRRQHAGPGFAYVTDESVQIAGWKIIRVMLRHIWPRDQPSLKARVVIAVGLLIGAKVSGCVVGLKAYAVFTLVYLRDIGLLSLHCWFYFDIGLGWSFNPKYEFPIVIPSIQTVKITDVIHLYCVHTCR